MAAYAAGELSPAERARLGPAVEGCPACRREAEAYRRAIGALKGGASVSLSADEAAAFLPEVHRRIAEGRATPVRPARPGLRELVWDYPRLSLASVCTAALLAIGLTLSQVSMWSLSGSAGPNGVEIVSVDVDEDASVMVFQAPDSSLKVIWVF